MRDRVARFVHERWHDLGLSVDESIPNISPGST